MCRFCGRRLYRSEQDKGRCAACSLDGAHRFGWLLSLGATGGRIKVRFVGKWKPKGHALKLEQGVV